MKCSKCNTENTYKTDYCVNCGKKFTKEEQEAAYFKTFWGKVEKVEDRYKTLTLKKFFSSRPVQIAVILVILALGIFNLVRNGAYLRVEKSSNYTVEYNQKLNTSYLNTALDAVDVSFYLPHAAEDIVIKRLDAEGHVTEEMTIKPEDAVKLEASFKDYYQVVANYTKSGTERQYIYLFKTIKTEGQR